ncbi:MAG: hypothetical protein IJC50_04215 [Clostridia bacterium]|nr:hypothetical protein [Clostridia bacterium]
MKKTLSAILSVIMVLGMLAIAGCGAKNPFLGSWSGEIDMVDLFNESVAEGIGDATMAEYFTVDEFKVKMTFTFTEKSASFDIDKASMESAVIGVKDDLVAGMTRFYQDYATALGMTFEELLASADAGTVEEQVDAMFTEEMMDELFSSDDFSGESKYRFEDGKLYLSDDMDSEISEDEYMEYVIEGDTLTFEQLVSDDDDTAAMWNYICPLTLKKN